MILTENLVTGKLLSLLPDELITMVNQTVKTGCDWGNNDSPIAGMQPVEVFCVTLLAVLLLNYLCGFIRFIWQYASVKQMKTMGFRFASTYIP